MTISEPFDVAMVEEAGLGYMAEGEWYSIDEDDGDDENDERGRKLGSDHNPPPEYLITVGMVVRRLPSRPTAWRT